jgi:Tol biopolymer transport system component
LFPIAEEIGGDLVASMSVSASSNGVLVYRAGQGETGQLTWMDRTGKTLGLVGAPATINGFSISPDGKRVAISRGSTLESEIWLHELDRNTETRFTMTPPNTMPSWSSDGRRVLYSGVRVGGFDLFQKEANGSGQEEMILKGGPSKAPFQWSPNSKYVLYNQRTFKNELWMLPYPNGKPVPFRESRFNDTLAKVSPDGRWIAYSSDDTGRYEVYVQPFPAGSGRWKVSTAGGSQPRWSPDGKQIFYVASRQLMAVQVKAGSSFETGAPTALFQAHFFDPGFRSSFDHQYDISPDGKRFLVNVSTGDASEQPLNVTVNWQKAAGK